jgi:hypothetical protein
LTWAAVSPKFSYQDAVDDRAEEGTALHEIVEKCIDFPSLREERLASLDPGQRGAVEFCLEHADEVVAQFEGSLLPGSVNTYTEMKVKGEPWEFGTVDLAVTGLAAHGIMEAHVSDWKFGLAELPAPPENAQMAAYVQGAFNRFPKLQRCTVTLVSARLRKKYSHTYMRTDCAGIQRWCEEIIASKEDPSVPCRPSDACVRCRWRSTCKFLVHGISEILPPSTELPTLDLTCPENRGRAYQFAKIMEAAGKQLSSDIKAMLVDGEEVPGYKLQQASRSAGGVPLDEFFALLSDQFPDLDPHELLSHGSVTRGGMRKIVEDLCRENGHPIKKTTDAFFEEAEAKGMAPPVTTFQKMVRA